MRRSRSGFTLMEVTIALAITGVVAALAASALHAAIDTRERIEAHRLTVDAEARAMSWIGEMLRHPPAASAVDEPVLRIVPHSVGGDVLVFLSRGVEEPLGTGAVWRVTIEAESDGLHVRAEPVNRASNRTPVATVLPHIRSLRAEALERASVTNAATWRSDWPLLRSMPGAVRLTFDTGAGTPVARVFAVASLELGTP